MSATANRVIKNTGYLYARMGITMFISLYTTRLILDSLGVNDFGIYNIVGSAIALLGFINAAMSKATQRFMSYVKGEGNLEKQKDIFNTSIILHLVISIIVGIGLLLLSFFLFKGILNIPIERIDAAKIIYCSLIISVIFTIINVPFSAVLNAHENMRFYAIIGIFESLLKLLVAIVCVYTSADKLIIYGILMSLIPIINTIIMKVYCSKKYEECIINPFKYCKKTTFTSMTTFAGWNFLPSISSVLTQYGFGFVLNYFYGVALNAAQGIANQLSGQLMAFSNNMLKAIGPIIDKEEGSGNRQSMLNLVFSGSKFSFFILGCFAIPFMLQMPFILNIWLKDVPKWAICFANLQLLRSLTEQLTITVNSAIYAQGNISSISKIKTWLNILPLLLTSIAFYFELQPYWMYISWIICGGVIGGCITLYYAVKQCDLNIIKFLTEVVKPTLLTVFLSVIIGYIPMFWGNNIYSSCISMIIAFLTFLIFAWTIGCNKSEKEMFKSILIKIRQKINYNK